jgi:hypothetical protein
MHDDCVFARQADRQPFGSFTMMLSVRFFDILILSLYTRHDKTILTHFMLIGGHNTPCLTSPCDRDLLFCPHPRAVQTLTRSTYPLQTQYPTPLYAEARFLLRQTP